MPFIQSRILLLSLSLFFVSINLINAQNKTDLPTKNFEQVKSIFKLAPDTIITGTYWYWISGNISKDGVIKDLEAMKKVGINRAYIGNVFLDDVVEGKVKMFSDEWWDILHAALKKAGELNITIGIFNAPGWSQSGGPWVKPSQAMRYLASSTVQIQGPLATPIQLQKPKPEFQDVKVIAYEVPKDFNQSITENMANFTSSPQLPNLNYLFDNNEETKINLKRAEDFILNITTNQPQTIRSVEFQISQQAIAFHGELQVKKDGVYETIKKFKVDRSNPAANVGWAPFAPAVISVEPTKASSFRIKISKVSRNGALAEIKLSGTPKIENFAEKSLAKMFPTPLPLADAYSWPVQPDQSSGFIINPEKVIDISTYMDAGGLLSWKAPKGNWVIERIGMLPTGTENAPAPPEGRGLEVDKMSKSRIEEHFNAHVGEILKRIPAGDRKSLKIVVADSYEMGGQNWTDELEEKFKKVYGYDPTPYLPALSGKVIGSEDKSDRFLWDLRRLVADEVAYGYVGGLTNISNQNGMTTWLENYGHWGFPGEFLQYGGQANEIGGEFWAEGDLGNIENRAASSSAHIYGKKVVFAESFTSAGKAFSRYPDLLKKRADRFFTEGINSTILHVYVSQNDEIKNPGLATWFGTEFHRKNTWFNDMDIFLQYLKRCGFLLQQGNYVADVAYFIGEDAPKMTGEQSPKLPKGYSFDYINGEVIKNRLTFQNGKLTLPDGLNYSIIVLPNSETIRPEILEKLRNLVEQGATLLGKKPQRSPGLQNFPQSDQLVKTLAADLWGNIDGKQNKINHYGKGLVIDGMDLSETVNQLKIKPDFVTSTADSIQFIHRTFENSEIYFLSNQGNSKVKTLATFRVGGKTPELWSPTSGNTKILPQFSQVDGGTQIPIELGAGESTFIVFTSAVAEINKHKQNYPVAISQINIKNPWTVKFYPQDEKAYKEMKLNQLIDWAKSDADSIKYFSGTATYTNVFKSPKVEKKAEIWLDLGAVYAIAKVKVNGKDVGGVWTAPYRINISNVIKKGNNNLEIRVVNTWKNKLIGDSKLPEEQRKASIAKSLDISGGLQSSGLIGPVKIYTTKN